MKADIWGTSSSADTLKRIANAVSETDLLALAEEMNMRGYDLLMAKCYLRAAQLGSAEGQYRLGEAYEMGMGVLCDEKRAVYWYTKAAAQRHADAMSVLADYYYDGIAVQQNDDLAKALLLLLPLSEERTDRLQRWFHLNITAITDAMLQQAENLFQRFTEIVSKSIT